MIRATCVTATLLLSAAVILPAQSRNRDFGLSEAAWCSEARDAQFCEVREDTLKGLDMVNIDARGNGGVHVRGWAGNDVHVRVRISAHTQNQPDALALVKETQLSTGNGRIRTEGPRMDDRDRWRGRRDRAWWAASYEVQVPRTARVTVGATNGGIIIEDVRGAVEAETTNGGLAFYDVSGDVRGQAVNGGIRVELSGNQWQGAGLDVRTTNGGVQVFLPSNFSAELEARATNGGVNVDFPITVRGLLNNRREVRATIGSGGPLIRVATTNGGVRISQR